MDKLDQIKKQKINGVIDCHSHCGISIYNFFHRLFPYAQNMEDLIRKTNSSGVDWIICFPITCFYFSIDKMLRDGSTIYSGLDKAPFALTNEHLLRETEMFGKNVLPFLMVHPKVAVKRQCQLIEKWTKKYRIYGLKFTSIGTSSSPLDLINTPFPDIAIANNWPIMIHSDPGKSGHPLNAVELARKYPDLRVCVAHNGRFLKSFWDKTDNDGNIFVDTSPFLLSCQDSQRQSTHELLPLDYAQPKAVLKSIFKKIPDRLIWGTDEPWTKISRVSNQQNIIGGNYEAEKEFLDSLPAKIKKRIAWDNPKKYLSID